MIYVFTAAVMEQFWKVKKTLNRAEKGLRFLIGGFSLSPLKKKNNNKKKQF